MAAAAPSTRERMIMSTALLVRERGASATSIDDVLQHSGAPRGSVYHHFPGGRNQMLREATDYAGDFMAERLARLADLHPVQALDRIIGGYRKQLVSHDHRAGCPVAAVAIEAAQGEGDADLLAPAAAVFDRWQALMAAHYVAHGATPERGAELAVTVLAGLQGALVLCKAHRDVAPLDVVHQQLRTLLASELDPEETA
jgi:AcrR family transcriptional regulator